MTKQKFGWLFALVATLAVVGCGEKIDPQDGTTAPGDYKVAPGSEPGAPTPPGTTDGAVPGNRMKGEPDSGK